MASKNSIPRRRHRTGVRQPQQARSRDSFERMLLATEELLVDREFDEISVQQIVERAQTSVGAFYNRFKVKDALLPYLLSRHLDEQVARSRVLFQEMDWTGVPLVDRVGQLFHHAIRTGRLRTGLYRTLFLRRMTKPHEIGPEELAKTEAVNKSIHNWLLQCADEMTHHDPPTAVQVGVTMCFNTIHSEVLFGEKGASRVVDLPDDRLVTELTCAMLAYVGVDDPAMTPDLTPPMHRLDDASKDGEQ